MYGELNMNNPYLFQRQGGYSQHPSYTQFLDEHIRMIQTTSLQDPRINSDQFSASQGQSSYWNQQGNQQGKSVMNRGSTLTSRSPEVE